ncbi:hypothetical protein FOVG_19748 [Fusarium oxysporum f. sp. pisi HDV247]|uniref:LYC1 C-terminal domain-containing protein n=1 Tax=Fusarium oxysporum f. sp. pisi HDV247 TaxID=1080344 RepID=W9NF96_FUSOX|nr:hypothetical protein FOVG_19748 [Fusarium oxysporum f. sp. pisi HDV247]
MSSSVTTQGFILSQATVAERHQIWEATFVHWGTALSLEDYIGREEHNLKAPLSKDGGLTQWILTDDSPKDRRPIFSACETYRKRALIANRDGVVRDAITYGIASVFTPPRHGGKGHAKKLMTLLARQLRATSNFSVLWSDIGPKYYHAVGWKPVKNAYLRLAASHSTTENDPNLRSLIDSDIPSLVEEDQQRLRQQLERPSSKVRTLILPDRDTIQWHLYRENYMCQKTLGRVPSVRGVLWTSPTDADSKIRAIWTRNFSGKEPEKNIVHVIRLSIDKEDIADKDLADGFKAIGKFIQTDAQSWSCGHIEIWNPEERLKRAALSVEELGAEFIVREHEHLASLQWYGQEDVDDIDWVCNEGFAWC